MSNATALADAAHLPAEALLTFFLVMCAPVAAPFAPMLHIIAAPNSENMFSLPGYDADGDKVSSGLHQRAVAALACKVRLDPNRMCRWAPLGPVSWHLFYRTRL